MSKKLKRSAVALVLAATMVFSSQGVLTAFAVGENETSTAVDVSALDNFILPEPASYVFFYAFSNLRNLLYIIRTKYPTKSA